MFSQLEWFGWVSHDDCRHSLVVSQGQQVLDRLFYVSEELNVSANTPGHGVQGRAECADGI